MLFLLDMSSLIHAYFHVKKVDDRYDVTERCLHRMEKMRHYFGRRFPECSFVAVFDSESRKTYRKVIWPEYKSSRTKHADLPMIEYDTRLAVENDADWIGVMAPGMFEADDVIATLATHHDGKILIHSEDSDFHSLLSSGRVTIVKKSNTPEPGGDMVVKYFTEDDLFLKYGLTPVQWQAYQVIVGGKDDVPGWAGVGEKTAIELIEDDLYDMKLEGMNKRQQNSYPEFQRLLPTIVAVRTLHRELDWPENVPFRGKV